MTSLLMTFVAIATIPIIPMIIALLLSLATAVIASRFRYANLIIVVLNMLVLLSLMLSSIFLKKINLKQLTQLGKLIEQRIQSTYPLATWLNDGLVHNNWVSFLAFISISLLCGAVFIFILEKFYLSLNSKLFFSHKSKTFRWSVPKQNSPLLALYKREWQFYLANPIYVMNTLFGSIILIFLSIVLLFLPLNKLEMMLSISNIKIAIQPYLPLLPVVLSIFLVIGTTTSSSISLEGKNHWQLAVLPIKLSLIYQVKLLLNLTIVLPAIIISNVVLSFTFKITGGNLLFLFLVPIAYSLFSELIGLLMDCLYTKFDWTSTQQVVKQSFANLLTLGINLLTIFLGFGILLVFSAYRLVALSLLTILLLSLALYLYKKIIRKNPFAFE